MISSQDFSQLKYQSLQHFWGFSQFREFQEQIVDDVIHGKDTLVLLPTGGGKSLCYQLPAILLEGTCLVISPLLALMKDQVGQLHSRNIEAEYLSSELDDFEAENIFSRCKEGITKILYVSPERLTNPFFLQQIQEFKISFIAVDEAHCISEWGQDFRPSYQHIKVFREQFVDTACIALTATATPKVMEEIQTKLALRNPTIYQKSYRRSNIKTIIDQVSDKYQRIFEILKYNQNSGIVYTRTRKEAEELTQFLKKNKLQNVDFFHAGLSRKDKQAKQNLWLQSNQQVLISTNAFGMGIDKDNVRFVIHFSPSASIENYYQEIGRAGRDGNESFAFMLWNVQELLNFDNILRNQIPSKSEFQSILEYLYSVFQIAEHDLPESSFQLDFSQLKKLTKLSLPKIRNVLNFLHHQEIIFLNTMKSLSSIELKISLEEVEILPKKDAYFMEMLLRSVQGFSTHKSSFSELALSKKLGADLHLIKERIKDLQRQGYLDYVDGELASIKFLHPRNDHYFDGKYWNLFYQIQKNKIQKWEEMKYFLQDDVHCKMKLILSYFGEKNAKNCGQCSVCERKNEGLFGKNISSEIVRVLTQKPASVDEIALQLHYYQKDNILENLILLLDAGKVKMRDFRTYMLK